MRHPQCWGVSTYADEGHTFIFWTWETHEKIRDTKVGRRLVEQCPDGVALNVARVLFGAHVYFPNTVFLVWKVVEEDSLIEWVKGLSIPPLALARKNLKLILHQAPIIQLPKG